MSDVSTPLPYDENLHLIVRIGTKIYVTGGAYIYDTQQPEITSEESAAIAYMNGKLGSGDVAILDPDTAEAGAFILFAEG